MLFDSRLRNCRIRYVAFIRRSACKWSNDKLDDLADFLAMDQEKHMYLRNTKYLNRSMILVLVAF